MTTSLDFSNFSTSGTTLLSSRERFIRRARLMLPFVLLGLAPGASAHASDFQQYLQGTCGGLICTVNFSKVPAGKKLQAAKASCYLRIKNSTNFVVGNLHALQLLLIKADGSVGMAETLPAVRTAKANAPTGGEISVYQSNEDVLVTANAGQRFQAFAQFTEGVVEQMACHVSGQLLP
jgi:hypothetical protein